MPFIEVKNNHLISKRFTGIETLVKNLAFLMKQIDNRILIGPIPPSNSLLGDIWKDTSTDPPVQRQCIGFNSVAGDGYITYTPIWEDFMTLAPYEVSVMYERIQVAQGLLDAIYANEVI
jgi:hypothetical protein